MKIEITFKNMQHSAPLEAHARTKLEKLTEFMRGSEAIQPFGAELHLDNQKVHPHHHVELHLRVGHTLLHSRAEGPDMYVAVDQAIDKMVTLLVKEKDKFKDKKHKQENEKSKFGSDKYTDE
jgi:ribosomal subunit interface protein